jgi:hypothetical protein
MPELLIAGKSCWQPATCVRAAKPSAYDACCIATREAFFFGYSALRALALMVKNGRFLRN